jgi:hypothetical protein
MYTPGPWKIGKRDSVVGADGFEVCDPDQGPFLSEKFNSAKKHWGSTPGSHIERSEEEIRSNARLIAAAPELYRTVKDLLEKIGPREWSPRWNARSFQKEYGKLEKLMKKVEEE